MFITIAICTLNRAESLRRTLDSLVAMRVPDDLRWEIVVVNNGCTDHTDDVIREFTGRLPLRRGFEPERGHSRARNRAVEVAKGDYIVWTDDDVVADLDWLAAYAEAFRRWPEAAVFGGRITEEFETPLPKWLVGNEAMLSFAARDFGDKALPLSIPEGRLPFGANFAVRAVEQRNFRYNPDLGLGPVRRRLGDEIDVVERILNSGATGYWIPRSRVTHHIGHDRLTVRNLKGYYAGYGESEALRGRDAAMATPFWFGAPRWVWRELIAEWLHYRVHRLISPAPVWVEHLRDYSRARGAIRYWRSERR